MARPRPEPTPIQTFLAPLARLAQRQPAIEALVFWHSSGWPDEPTEELEAEEIAFWAEGLLDEGFAAAWQHLASATGDAHIRLLFWQSAAPDLPALPQGWSLVAQGLHGA